MNIYEATKQCTKSDDIISLFNITRFKYLSNNDVCILLSSLYIYDYVVSNNKQLNEFITNKWPEFTIKQRFDLLCKNINLINKYDSAQNIAEIINPIITNDNKSITDDQLFHIFNNYYVRGGYLLDDNIIYFININKNRLLALNITYKLYISSTHVKSGYYIYNNNYIYKNIIIPYLNEIFLTFKLNLLYYNIIWEFNNMLKFLYTCNYLIPDDCKPSISKHISGLLKHRGSIDTGITNKQYIKLIVLQNLDVSMNWFMNWNHMRNI